MMRQHHNNSNLHVRHDEESENYSQPDLDIAPPPKRRLRAPLWKRLRGLCFVLGFFGIIELGAAALTASYFDVTGVRLEGLSTTPDAPVQQLSQKLIGQNWLRADRAPVIKAIEKIPTVDNVQVRRVFTWPPQLKVVIQERQPVAIIGAGDTWWKVDSKGVPFQSVNRPDIANLYALTGHHFHPQLGKALPEAEWKQVAQLLKSIQADQQLDAKGFRWNLRRIYFDKNGNASLRLKDAPHQELLLQLGNDQWPAKLSRARQALAYLDNTGQRAKVLNFVSYKIPTWIPADGNTSPAVRSNVQESA